LFLCQVAFFAVATLGIITAGLIIAMGSVGFMQTLHDLAHCVIMNLAFDTQFPVTAHLSHAALSKKRFVEALAHGAAGIK
jgi:hypothetical protein